MLEQILADAREQTAREIAASPARIDAAHLAHIDAFIHRVLAAADNQDDDRG